MKARLLLIMTGVWACGAVRASSLSTEPSIGVASEFSSNPYLLSAGGHDVGDIALLASAPTHFDADADHFSLTPGIRYSSSGSYASLSSNYFHLDGNATLTRDLDTLTLTSSIGRDSSLYQSGLKSNGIGVRSDSSLASIDWQRTLSERMTLNMDVSWNRVLFSQAADLNGLVDYRYLSEGGTVKYSWSERTSFLVSASAGQYSSLTDITSSKNYNLQIGATTLLTELWTLSAGAGYAKSENQQKLFYGPYFIGGVQYGPYYLGTDSSTQKGPVLSVNLQRQGENFTVAATASRVYRPSGFEFLSRTDSADISGKYRRTERLDFGLSAEFQQVATPGSNGAVDRVRYLKGVASTDWRWTENWTVSLSATWVKVKYEIPPVNTDSTGASLKITRQFGRVDLQ